MPNPQIISILLPSNAVVSIKTKECFIKCNITTTSRGIMRKVYFPRISRQTIKHLLTFSKQIIKAILFRENPDTGNCNELSSDGFQEGLLV